MQQLLAVGVGGFVGAISRYTLTGLAQRISFAKFGREYPVGTLLVNVLGCLIIGILMALVIHKQLSESVRLLLITGFLGSLTTFSTFGYETVEYIREGDLRLAMWNVAANMLLGCLAVWLGLVLGSWGRG